MPDKNSFSRWLVRWAWGHCSTRWRQIRHLVSSQMYGAEFRVVLDQSTKRTLRPRQSENEPVAQALHQVAPRLLGRLWHCRCEGRR